MLELTLTSLYLRVNSKVSFQPQAITINYKSIGVGRGQFLLFLNTYRIIVRMYLFNSHTPHVQS
jgi:hypothetical protein